MEVSFVNSSSVVSQERLERACEKVEEIVGDRTGEVSIVFVDQLSMASLNEQYRGKPQATNVLAFPLQDDTLEENSLWGDIFICEEKACSPEKQTKEHCEEEIIYLTIHALLHVYGYDHQTEDDFEKMRDLESRIWNSEKTEVSE